MNLRASLNAALFGKVNSNFYTENKELLDDTNFHMLKTACVFSSCMCLFLFALTFFNDTISDLKGFYLIFTLYFVAITAIVFIYVKKHKRLASIGFYVFAIAILLLAADIGILRSLNDFAVTFYVFLIIIPMLRVGKPMYAVILSLCSCIIFSALTYYIKMPNLRVASNDILNAFCCCFVGIGLNITFINLQLENLQAKVNLEHISTIDELTLLPNRRCLNSFIDSIFEGEHDNITIIMMDIDNFKSFNDIFGHLHGDECLRRIGKLLQETALQYSLFISRFGGEEFVAVSTAYDINTIGAVCDDIVRSVEALDIANGLSPLGRVTISMGYSDLKSTGAESYMDLINCADDALYVSKTNGKNRATAYNGTLLRR